MLPSLPSNKSEFEFNKEVEEVKEPVMKKEVDREEMKLRQERLSRIVQTETSKYYQDLIPNKVTIDRKLLTFY
jgi:hypothetical protein